MFMALCEGSGVNLEAIWRHESYNHIFYSLKIANSNMDINAVRVVNIVSRNYLGSLEKQVSKQYIKHEPFNWKLKNWGFHWI